jgi:hypothetical protein
MAFQKRRCQVNGVRYASRTLAIQSMLEAKVRKCQIIKQLGTKYPFIYHVEKKMLAEKEENS